MSTWLAGRKTLTPISTSRPPLILRVTLPLTTSPSWYLEMTISQARIRCAFLRERTISPVSSSMPSSRTSTVVARLGRRLVLPLVQRDETLRLVADVDDHLVADDLDDLARDDAADLEALAARRGIGRARSPPSPVDDGGQLVVADVEFAEQVAIYHVRPFRSKPLSHEGEGMSGMTPRRGDPVTIAVLRPARLARAGRRLPYWARYKEAEEKNHPSTQGVG